MASIRAERQRFLQSPFTFRLSALAAKSRRPTRKPRRCVACRFCGAIKVIGNGRGDHSTRDANEFWCDPECRSGSESFAAKSDPIRKAKRQASRARARANELKKRQLANVGPCSYCQAPTSRKRFCSDECCKLAKRANKKTL